jgi:hypothetical protein
MMNKRYQVVSQAVLVTTDTISGPMLTTVYRGGVVVGDPDTDQRLRHNVESGYLAEIPSDATGGVDAVGDAVATGKDGTPVDGGKPADQAGKAFDAEAQTRREDAAAKLPADGSAPDGRASEAVWVEYAVSKGVNRADAEKAGKDELRRMLAAQQQQK